MKYFSLFSGVGGFELAIKDECVGFSEIDKYAISVYKYHYPNHKNYGDITQIDWSTVPDFDLVVGGSPCQDLSVAGKQQGLNGDRSGLFFEYIRCLEEKQPTNFIWENVKGAFSSNRGWDFTAIQNSFSEAGYDVEWQVLNAKDFGVPQNRERVFVVGHLRGKSRPKVFPISRDNPKTLREITSKLSDAQRVYDPSGLAKSQKALGGGMGAKTGLYAVRKNLGKIEQTKDEALCIDQSYHKGLDNHGQRTAIAIPVITPDRIVKKQNGRRFKTNGDPSFTLNSQDKHGVFDGIKIRRLTPLECERLMSWPDDWTRWGHLEVEGGMRVAMSDTQRYKMCGNGVVTDVVRHIINKLFNNENKEDL